MNLLLKIWTIFLIIIIRHASSLTQLKNILKTHSSKLNSLETIEMEHFVWNPTHVKQRKRKRNTQLNYELSIVKFIESTFDERWINDTSNINVV